jgi:hypothetical protein
VDSRRMLEADGSPVQPGGKSRGQGSQPLNRYDQSVIASSQSSMKREGERKRSRSNSSDGTTVLSPEMWRRCVHRSPKNSHVYRMDTVSCSVCKVQGFFV